MAVVVLLLLRSAAAALPDAAQVFAGVVAEVDRNADGRIQPDEYARVAAADGFARIDADHDGAIDAGELQDYTEATPLALRVVHAGPGLVLHGQAPSVPPAPAGRSWLPLGIAAAVGSGAAAAWLGRRGGRRRRGRG